MESLSLPARLAERYRPESCLSDAGVWLLRDESGNRFILKIDRGGERDLAAEYALMQRLPPELEGRVPRAVDCFREGETCCLLRTFLPGAPCRRSGSRATPGAAWSSA